MRLGHKAKQVIRKGEGGGGGERKVRLGYKAK